MPSIEHILSSQLCRKAVETNLIQRQASCAPISENCGRLIDWLGIVNWEFTRARICLIWPVWWSELGRGLCRWKALARCATTDEACLLSVGILARHRHVGSTEDDLIKDRTIRI